jgi:hypothetical protein
VRYAARRRGDLRGDGVMWSDAARARSASASRCAQEERARGGVRAYEVHVHAALRARAD